LKEGPPEGAGGEETGDEEASALSWRSVEDDLSDDSSLARLAHSTNAAGAASNHTALRDSASSGSERWEASSDAIGARKWNGRAAGSDKPSATSASATASPAQSTPHRRNYFVQNLELESPNKVRCELYICAVNLGTACSKLCTSSGAGGFARTRFGGGRHGRD
jgi:hypothetical protein